MNNAKYAISVARKMGATVCLVWEHIRDVNNTYYISLYDLIFKVILSALFKNLKIKN